MAARKDEADTPVLEADTWFYSKDGPKLFEAGEEIPGDGWFDHPTKAGLPE